MCCFLNTYYIRGLRSKLHVYWDHHSRIQEAENTLSHGRRVSVERQEAGGCIAYTTKQGGGGTMSKARTEELGAEL